MILGSNLHPEIFCSLLGSSLSMYDSIDSHLCNSLYTDHPIIRLYMYNKMIDNIVK